MFGFNTGAMVVTMALFLFTTVSFLGGVNPLLSALPIALLLVLCLVWVVKNAQDQKHGWSWTPMDGAIGGFLVYSVARYLTSPINYDARNELILIVCCGLTYFISAKEFSTKEHRKLFLLLLMGFALFQAGFGIWQSITKSDFIFHWERPELYNGRGSGTFVCPNHLAGFLEMSLGLIVARAAIVRRESNSVERSVIIKFCIVYIAIMVAIGILTTLSRAGWASVLVGMSVLVAFGSWKWRQAAARLGIVSGVLVCMTVALWSLEPVRNYLLKSLALEGGNQPIALNDPTLGGRTMMWTGTLNIIQENPVFGTGLGSWQWMYQKHKDYRILSFPNYTHNDYLNLASDYGLIGVILMIFVFICFFKQAVRIATTAISSEDRAFAVGAVVSVISILFHSWFDFNLHIFGNALFLALILGITSAIGMNSPLPSSVSLLRRRATCVGLAAIVGLLVHLFVPTVRAYRLTDLGDTAKAELAYDEAFSLYARAASIDPKYPRPLIKTGDIYFDQAKWRVGKVKQRERVELAQKAVASYDRALMLNPYLSDIWVSKGQALELVGQNDSAKKSFLKAIEVAPVSAYAHFAIGQFYRKQGDNALALEAFAKADKYYLHNDPMFHINQWEGHETQ